MGVEVGEREHGLGARQVLRDASVASLVEAPDRFGREKGRITLLVIIALNAEAQTSAKSSFRDAVERSPSKFSNSL